MPPKRKAEVLEPVLNLAVTPEAASKVGSQPHDAVVVAAKTNITKKPRSSIAGGDFAPGAEEAHSSIAGEGSAAGAKRVKASKHADKPWQSWRDVVLEGEEEGDVPIYDDCNDIRRKIRRLEKQPGFKITHWLKEIGGINHNSYQRFMRATGPTGGAENGTYYAAYVYFEKVRIFEGKKKSAKRLRNEWEHPGGFPREDMRRKWVFVVDR